MTRLPLLGLVACAAEGPGATGDTGPEPLCPAADVPALDVAHDGGAYGALDDGAPVGCGIPPQGGAPYTPFRLRLTGLEGAEDGVTVAIDAVDAGTGEPLGGITQHAWFVCANVGDDAGHQVGSDVHLRYDGQTVDGLVGREAAFTFTITSDAGAEARLEGTGRLVDL